MEFYHWRSGALAPYHVDASTAEAAVLAGRLAVLAERPFPAPRRRRPSLYARAERATAHDDNGWVLYRMRRDDGPEHGNAEPPVPSVLPG